MKKILNFLLRKLYGTKVISFNDFASQVAEIAKKYNKNHWKVETSIDGFGDIYFKGYVQGYWSKDMRTPEEVLQDLIKHCTIDPNQKVIEEVFINNDSK